jgi:hypothetical protein
MKTSGIEDTDMNPHRYDHLIFDKGAKNIASSTNLLKGMSKGFE